MQDLSIRKTGELSSVAKEVFETMLGRRLRDDEEVAIWASGPHQLPTGAGRADAWRQLNQHLERMALKVTGGARDLEKVIDEVVTKFVTDRGENSFRYELTRARGHYVGRICPQALTAGLRTGLRRYSHVMIVSAHILKRSCRSFTPSPYSRTIC